MNEELGSLQARNEEQRARVLVTRALSVIESALRALICLSEQDDDRLYRTLSREILREHALRSARQCGLVAKGVTPQGRLFVEADAAPGLRALVVDAFDALPAIGFQPTPDDLGALLEGLLAHRLERKSGARRVVPTRGRKSSGSFYTPVELSERVALVCLSESRHAVRFPRLRVCDPSVGAGAFLLAAARVLTPLLAEAERVPLNAARRIVVEQCLFGVDVSPLAVAVAETSLWLHAGDPTFSPALAGAHLTVADALTDELPHTDFDLVIGNPPWVAYAGRAAKPLAPERRKFFAARFAAFRGYPTLHGMFVERAAALAPRGTVGLLVPSPIADLAGYGHVRRALTRTHRVREPLVEFGQDAFESVTQPCFALIADARPEPASSGDVRPFRLSERQRAGAEASEVFVPEPLVRLLEQNPLPRELFGEMGFQSRKLVSEQLFRRGPQLPGFDYPLLEGKDVAEFRVGEPRLFMKPDLELLKRLGCRLRLAEDYRKVRFVVRQTAKVTIAALHSGLPFRNTLLAGFEHPEYSAELMVGLLNSALYRALHLAARRDARQAAFPQVKIAHLRSLPEPPAQPELRARVAELALALTTNGVERELRAALDLRVFELFGFGAHERRSVLEFVQRRAPELGHAAD